jgi:hypothetical protein
MKKNICIGLCVILCAAALSGEAPELQVVMPNSWKKLEYVADAEAEQIVKTVQPDITKALGYDAADSFFTSCTYSTVYRQATKDAVFYRLVFSNCPVSEIASLNHWFYQALVRQTKKGYRLYGMAVYNYLSATMKDEFDGVSFGAIDIVESDGKNAKGILFSLVGSSVTPPQNCLQTGLSVKVPYKFAYTTKKQLSGGTDARYYLLRDLERSDFSIESRQFTEWYEPKGDMGITITASHCLLDARCPLKYSIQNAFDGDSATSYVENTDDDLMEINCDGCGKPTRIAVINGYASNDKLYQENNRIRIIKSRTRNKDGILWGDPVDVTIQLKEMMMHQVFKYGANYLFATAIDNGTKYNDTCMAELNFYVNNSWLFGDINE